MDAPDARMLEREYLHASTPPRFSIRTGAGTSQTRGLAPKHFSILQFFFKKADPDIISWTVPVSFSACNSWGQTVIFLLVLSEQIRSEAIMGNLKDVEVKTWETGGCFSTSFKKYHAKVKDKKTGKSAEATGGTKDKAIENAKTSLEKML
jgi:hypothetical protein